MEAFVRRFNYRLTSIMWLTIGSLCYALYAFLWLSCTLSSGAQHNTPRCCSCCFCCRLSLQHGAARSHRVPLWQARIATGLSTAASVQYMNTTSLFMLMETLSLFGDKLQHVGAKMTGSSCNSTLLAQSVTRLKLALATDCVSNTWRMVTVRNLWQVVGYLRPHQPTDSVVNQVVTFHCGFSLILILFSPDFP